MCLKADPLMGALRWVAGNAEERGDRNYPGVLFCFVLFFNMEAGGEGRRTQ